MQEQSHISAEPRDTHNQRIEPRDIKAALAIIRKSEECVKALTNEAKPLRTKIKENKEIVTQYMMQEKKKDMDLLKHELTIELYPSEKKIKPQKEDILRRMSDYLKDAEKAQDLYDICFQEEVEVCEKVKFKKMTKKRKTELEAIKQAKTEQ